MRLVALLLSAVVFVPARAADPPKVDLKKGVEFTGRAEARVVEIRARVSGYLTRVHVKGGEAVKKGDLIAEVDDRIHKAELDIAKAKLTKAQAAAKIAAENLARVKAVVEKGIEGKEALSKAEAGLDEAKADLEVARATLLLAEVNLSYTKLTAPMDGRLGHLAATEGDLVKADETRIVSVVAADPIAVAFDVDERTALAVMKALDDGGKLSVEVAQADDEGYPHKATPEAKPLVVDPATGTIRFRATLANPKGLILHGQFLRVRLGVQPK